MHDSLALTDVHARACPTVPSLVNLILCSALHSGAAPPHCPWLMPRRLPVTDWNFDTDADVPTLSYPPALSPNSHICCHSMFKTDALLAERRASSSSRRSNNAGRTRPGKFRASSHSSVPQPRHRQDATSSPTIAHTMDATSPTTRHAYPAKLGRGDARYGKNCDCSKGSR